MAIFWWMQELVNSSSMVILIIRSIPFSSPSNPLLYWAMAPCCHLLLDLRPPFLSNLSIDLCLSSRSLSVSVYVHHSLFPSSLSPSLSPFYFLSTFSSHISMSLHFLLIFYLSLPSSLSLSSSLCFSPPPPPPVSLSPSLPPAFLLFLSCNLCLSFLLLLFKLMIPFCLYVAVLSIVKLRDLANRKRPNRFASRPRRRGARPASLPRGVPLLLLCPKKINLWRKAHLEDMAVSAQGSSKPQSSLGLTFSVQTIVNQPKLKVADKFFSCSTTSL